MTAQKFAALVSKGWSLDHIFVLQNIGTAPQLLKFPRGASIIQALFRKGMIDEHDGITNQGIELLKYSQDESAEDVVKLPKPKIKEGLDGLHKKLQDKLIELTGTRQKTVDIYGSKYYFLCGETELKDRLKKVMVKYNLSDIQAIEKALMNYIIRCSRNGKWTPLLPYYIIKQKEGVDMSMLVADIQHNNDKTEAAKTKDYEI